MKKKVPEVTVVGDYKWDYTRNVIVLELLKCKTEKEFAKLMAKLYLSMGTKKQIIKRRKELGIKRHTKKDLKKFNKKQNGRRKK